MTTISEKASLLRSLHVPGDPLVVTNVWDAVTARIVASTPGVKALASASHAVSFAHGVPDGEGLSVEQALEAARLIVGATELPVSIDFERGYATTLDGLGENVARLVDTGAAGLNIEDTMANGALFPRADAAARIAAVRGGSEHIVINARVDALVRGSSIADAVSRANAYLEAGADCAFVLGLGTEQRVEAAITGIRGPVSVIGHGVSLARLAELGVARISFGPGILGLTLAHLRAATAQLTALGTYPEELGFEY